MSTLALPAPFFPGNLLPRWVSHVIRGFLLFAAPASPAGREEDRRLTAEALAGDPGFEKLVRAYEQLVYRTAFRFVNNETDASDVTQEVFLRVHKALPRFRGDSALSTWIYAITANLARNHLRSRKNREKVQVLAPENREEGGPGFWDRVADKGAVGALRLAENRQMADAILEALAGLPADFKEAVVLRDLEGLDYDEISRVLKTSLGTVKSRIARGRLLLREALKEWL